MTDREILVLGARKRDIKTTELQETLTWHRHIGCSTEVCSRGEPTTLRHFLPLESLPETTEGMLFRFFGKHDGSDNQCSRAFHVPRQMRLEELLPYSNIVVDKEENVACRQLSTRVSRRGPLASFAAN